jgi:hypothetical protein
MLLGLHISNSRGFFLIEASIPNLWTTYTIRQLYNENEVIIKLEQMT